MPEPWIPFFLLIICFIIGGLPLTGWLTKACSGKDLRTLGTGNISVSAAFYHGGQTAGILAVLSEAFKGISAVLLFRIFMPTEPVWEIVGLIGLVAGRFLIGRGAGTTNVVWGYLVHDWKTAFLVALVGGIGFTIFREKQAGRLSVLILLPLITALLHPGGGGRIVAVMVLSTLIALVYHLIPDDLDLSTRDAHENSKKMFQFFRGDRAIQTLEQRLSPKTSGNKASRLAELKRLGYPVPSGWVLPPGDDPQPLLNLLNPSKEHPLVVRSSAFGEDSIASSAAGQYDSILNITSQEELKTAIAQCQLSYTKSNAVRYRRDRDTHLRSSDSDRSNLNHQENIDDEGAMAVLIQPQIKGVFSGVAFSRDPVSRQGGAVIVEALPGTAEDVVSGRKTPEYYRVGIPNHNLAGHTPLPRTLSWQIPEDLVLTIEGTGDVPPHIIKQVAYLVRHLEYCFNDIPQDMEWSYDGQHLWVLQARPITTMIPIWTRKIASEVIPGFIRPLTWSINRPLTCGVWGDIFTIVLGDRSKGLDFTETATLHHSSAYFNATLLGDIFLRMGLAPTSLEFLTRGAKFSKPPILSTLRNVPGLMRLLRCEWDLVDEFAQQSPAIQAELSTILQKQKSHASVSDLLSDIHRLLQHLKTVTYYNILAPLSASLRQKILNVSDDELDTSVLPEVAALRSLTQLAASSRPLIPNVQTVANHRSTLLAALAESPDGSTVLNQLDRFIDSYGYLSDVATDIAVSTWSDDPRPVYDLFAQLLQQSDSLLSLTDESPAQNWKARHVQHRITLKGSVAELYNRLLAELRAHFIVIQQKWVDAHLLKEPGDIFFLTFDEVQDAVANYEDQFSQEPAVTKPAIPDSEKSYDLIVHDSNSIENEKCLTDGTISKWWESIQMLIEARKQQWKTDAKTSVVPFLVYGKEAPFLSTDEATMTMNIQVGQQLQGIGASPGHAKGTVKIVRSLQSLPAIAKEMILVVPYADSGWAPLLVQAGGLIAEVGGRLSHGAIIAREYGIPAVMDVQNGTNLLKDGQTVLINGEAGTITLL